MKHFRDHMKMVRSSVLTFHRHLGDSRRYWTVERREGYGHRCQFVVRCYVDDVCVNTTEFATEIAARREFERRVEALYA